MAGICYGNSPSAEARSSHLSWVCCWSPRPRPGAGSVWSCPAPFRQSAGGAAGPRHGHFSACPLHTHSSHRPKRAECLPWARHSTHCQGPLWDQGGCSASPVGFTRSEAQRLASRPMHAIPFCRLPGADCGFFSDSAICREAELFHGPRTDCRHQRRSEHKSQRVGITELPEVVCACEHSPRVSFLPCDP